MIDHKVSRRVFSTAAAGVAVGGLSVPSGGKAAVTSLPTDPVEQLYALVKMSGSMAEERVVKKTRGKIFAVLPDDVVLLYGMRGSESTWWRQIDDTTFVRFNSTMSFFTNPETDEFIDTYTSSINGVTIDLPVSYIRHKEGEWYTPMGSYYGSMKEAFPDSYPEKPLNMDWTLDGDIIRKQDGDSFPPILPQPSIEYASGFALASEVFDPDVKNAQNWGSGWNIMAGSRSPYKELGVLPGHVNWHFDSVKLENVEQLDDDYLERARAHSDRFDISPELDEGPSFFERIVERIQQRERGED